MFVYQMHSVVLIGKSDNQDSDNWRSTVINNHFEAWKQKNPFWVRGGRQEVHPRLCLEVDSQAPKFRCCMSTSHLANRQRSPWRHVTVTYERNWKLKQLDRRGKTIHVSSTFLNSLNDGEPFLRSWQSVRPWEHIAPITEPECSLSRSQQSDTSPNPEPDESSPHPPTLFLNIIF
jgi:hypothetical protein